MHYFPYNQILSLMINSSDIIVSNIALFSMFLPLNMIIYKMYKISVSG